MSSRFSSWATLKQAPNDLVKRHRAALPDGKIVVWHTSNVFELNSGKETVIYSRGFETKELKDAWKDQYDARFSKLDNVPVWVLLNGHHVPENITQDQLVVRAGATPEQPEDYLTEKIQRVDVRTGTGSVSLSHNSLFSRHTFKVSEQIAQDIINAIGDWHREDISSTHTQFTRPDTRQHTTVDLAQIKGAVLNGHLTLTLEGGEQVLPTKHQNEAIMTLLTDETKFLRVESDDVVFYSRLTSEQLPNLPENIQSLLYRRGEFLLTLESGEQMRSERRGDNEHWYDQLMKIRNEWREDYSDDSVKLYLPPREGVLDLPDGYVKPSWFDTIVEYLNDYPAIMVVGPTGNGKTTTVQVALEALGMPYKLYPCKSEDTAIKFVGGNILQGENGATVEKWRDGVVQECFKTGMALVLDEADTLLPEVVTALHNAMQDSGFNGRGRFISDEHGQPVYPTGLCPVIMIMNTYGGHSDNRNFTARLQLDQASLDRLVPIDTDYENEALILQARGFSAQIAEQVVSWAQDMREQVNRHDLPVSISPRMLVRIATDMQKHARPLAIAVRRQFVSKLPTSDRDILRLPEVF